MPTSSQSPDANRDNGVPVEELSGELIDVAWLSNGSYGAEAKASLKRANSYML